MTPVLRWFVPTVVGVRVQTPTHPETARITDLGTRRQWGLQRAGVPPVREEPVLAVFLQGAGAFLTLEP